MDIPSSNDNASTDAEEIGEMTLNDFKLWNSIALKSFLSLRKESVHGNIDTLAARAFYCYEKNIPVDEKQEHLQRTLLREYKQKLHINGSMLPDPMDLANNWVGEKTGMLMWPKLYFSDISRFYSDIIGKRDLILRLESEYKQGKAYRYYANSFIGEVMYNCIDDSSPFCLFKTKCIPSQRINMKQYDIWAIVRKDTQAITGGEIMNAYCTCTAGLLGSCNHVAGLLFRIESAVITGLTDPTCTSVKASWVVPTKKKQIEPGKLSKFIFTQETYMKKSTQQSKENRQSSAEFKMNFQVMSDSQFKNLQNHNETRMNLFNEVKDIIPKSCFVELIEQQKKSTPVEKVLDIPTLKEFADLYNDDCSEDDPSLQNDIFTESIYLTDEQIKAVYNATTKQAKSDEWFKHRQGRLTASRFKPIINCAKRLRQNVNEKCPEYLISSIMNYQKSNATWQMKHGMNTEIHAKAKYKSIFNRLHKHCKFNDPGMTILKSHPFISVSPDMEVECSCHGKGLVEIKCPATLISQIPSPENYKHLDIIDGNIVLRRNSEYFFQVQGQLAVTKKNYCDFFVFTFHGNLTVRVKFDQIFWDYMLDNLNWFWRNNIAPELLSGELEKRIQRVYDDEDIITIIRNNSIQLNNRLYTNNRDDIIPMNTDYENVILDIILEKN